MMGVGPMSCWGKWGSMQVGENQPATDFFLDNFLLNHFGGYVVPMLDQCWAIHLRAPQNVQIGRLLSQWLGRVPTEENIFGWVFLGHSSLSWNYSVAMLNV